MNKIISVLIISVLMVSQAKGIKRDTTYIKDLSKNFILKIQTSGRSTELDLKNLQVNKTFELKPNDSRSIGLAFSYRWLGLGIGFTPGYMNNDNKIYGKTDRIDLQINSYSKMYLINFYFQWYKGFYVNNPKTFDKNWNYTYYPTVPDAQIANMGGSFFFMTNPYKFSLRSVYLANEIQRKRAGTWLIGGGFNFSAANSKNYFVPEIWVNSPILDTLAILKNYSFLQMYASGGGSYTFVWFNGKLFLNLYLMLNFGPYVGSAGLSKSSKSFTKGSFSNSLSTDGRLSFGGNIGKKNRFFWGIYAVVFQYNYHIKDLYDISPTVKNAKLYFGYRFI